MANFFNSISNRFGFGSGSSSSSSTPSSPNQPSSDFNYKNPSDTNQILDDNSLKNHIPEDLVGSFTNLKKAINDKKKILEKYKGLYGKLEYIDTLLDKYINEDTQRGKNLDILQDEKTLLEDKRNALQINPPSTTNSLEIDELKRQIDIKQLEINKLNQEQSDNNKKFTAIGKLLQQATEYINEMEPKTEADIDNIQKLIDKIDKIKVKLGDGSATTNRISDAENFDIDYGNNGSSDFNVYNPLRKGGYRYSSSQMRRKSTARRSSASGSSSSKRRRNKKRTAKKMMLGGKRMKKAKSIKRKNHKKC